MPKDEPATKAAPPKVEAPSVESHIHMGFEIQELSPREFQVEGKTFYKLLAAQEYIDLVLLPKKLAKEKA